MRVNGMAQVGGFRHHRVAAGMSQQRLAELAGCSLSMVRLVESGYRPSPSGVLDRIAAALQDERPGDQTEPLVTTSARQGRRDTG